MAENVRHEPLLVVQARTESRRLPGKVVTDICGLPLLEWVVRRVMRSSTIVGVVVATTTRSSDDAIEALAKRCGVNCFRGADQDVLGRFTAVVEESGAAAVARVCGDSPFVDARTVDTVVEDFRRGGADIVENHLGRDWPFGVAVEVVGTETLRRLNEEATDISVREHVTLYAYQHTDAYTVRHVPPPPDLAAPDLRLCVDTADDLQRVRAICEKSAPSWETPLADIVASDRALSSR